MSVNVIVGAKKQSGHVLLLMTLLLSTGGVTLLLHQVSRAPLDLPVERALASRAVLVDARTALLSYSADYAVLYGPTGAGPGHLPCPDTDNANDPKRDGPNPPCGRERIASGKLPRHVTLPHHRHAFHDQPDQRIRYSVSAGYVNNPRNRLVNASGALQQFESRRALIVSSVSIPLSKRFGSTADTSVATAVITRDELMEVIHPAVVRWVMDNARARLMQRCLPGVDCPALTAAFEGWPISGEEIMEVNGVDLVRWISDPATGFVEGVPASRHWFVRNRWFNDVILRVSPECRAATSEQTALTCEFVPVDGVPALPLIILVRSMA